MWIPYRNAIEKNLTHYPRVGDKVLYQARRGKSPLWLEAKIERVIDSRRYLIRHSVPESIKSHFINGTTSAIAKISDLSFFMGGVEPTEGK
jgi:hypothetical protein